MARIYTVASCVAHLISAIRSCERSSNQLWQTHHESALDKLTREHFPSGSGIDAGVTLLHDKCSETTLVMQTSFHHMNDAGMYDGWTEHRVTIRASLIGEFSIQVSGRDRNRIKDYLADVFLEAMSRRVDLDSFYPARDVA